MSLNPKGYNVIADQVYRLDPVKYPNPNKQLQVGDEFNVNGQTYEVIDAIGNSEEPTDNGLQAMAVALIKDSEVA